MTDIVARAEECLQGITRGPWVVNREGWACISSGSDSVFHGHYAGECPICGEDVEMAAEVAISIEDAEFIAASPELVAELVAELKTTRQFRYGVAELLGFMECVEGIGNAILADDATILDYVRGHAETANKHECECPVWCDGCEHFELVYSCKKCGGSGCGPGTASGAYEPCADCDGDGRDHDFAYVHAPDVEAELKTTRAQLAAVEQSAQLSAKGGSVNHEQLVDFIAAIPDLTAHRFIDTDGEFSTKLHGPREVAERVANAIRESSHEVRRRVTVEGDQNFELPWANG